MKWQKGGFNFGHQPFVKTVPYHIQCRLYNRFTFCQFDKVSQVSGLWSKNDIYEAEENTSKLWLMKTLLNYVDDEDLS